MTTPSVTSPTSIVETALISGVTPSLPMKIYSMVRLGVTPEINAVSTILVGLVTLGVVTASIIGRRQKQQTI